MKRGPLLILSALFGLGAALLGAVAAALVCAAKGQHVPEPHPYIFGAYRCKRCEEPLSDLGEAGLIDGGGYVQRRLH